VKRRTPVRATASRKPGKVTPVGVSRFSAGGRFHASVRMDGRSVHLGSWETAADAAMARDRAILYPRLPYALHTPARAKRFGPASPEELRREARRLGNKRRTSSDYFGVVWERSRRRWLASVCLGGHRTRLIARFDRAKDAALAYDRVVMKIGERILLNFPDRRLKPASVKEMRECPDRSGSATARVDITACIGRAAPRGLRRSVQVEKRGPWAPSIQKRPRPTLTIGKRASSVAQAPLRREAAAGDGGFG
jgi:hypothetical protein